MQRANIAFLLTFTTSDLTVWIAEIRAQLLERKRLSMYWHKKHIRHLSDKANWKEAPSRCDNRESKVSDLQDKGEKIRKCNYSNDELNKVIKGSRRCREKGGLTFDVGECRQTTSRLKRGVALLESTRLFSLPGKICGLNTTWKIKAASRTNWALALHAGASRSREALLWHVDVRRCCIKEFQLLCKLKGHENTT